MIISIFWKLDTQLNWKVFSRQVLNETCMNWEEPVSLTCSYYIKIFYQNIMRNHNLTIEIYKLLYTRKVFYYILKKNSTSFKLSKMNIWHEWKNCSINSFFSVDAKSARKKQVLRVNTSKQIPKWNKRNWRHFTCHIWWVIESDPCKRKKDSEINAG